MSDDSFGKGFVYNLGLFLAHADRLESIKQTYGHIIADSKELESKCLSTWFYGATDHLYELDTENIPQHLKERATKFKRLCLAFREASFSPKLIMADYTWAIEEAKELLRLVDEHLDIPTEKANWS